MKALALPLLSILLTAPALAEKAVPLDNFRLNMTFGDRTEGAHTYIHLSGELEAGKDKPEFKVSYLAGNITNTRNGNTTNHFTMTEDDVGTLIRVAAAAEMESPMKVEVDYDNVAYKTTYEALEQDGSWKVIMKREEWAAEFGADEGEKLGGLLDDCMSSIAWYEKLFTADKLPEPTEDARPPTQVDDMTITASFGEVSMGDFGYRSDW